MAPVWEENGEHKWECPAISCPAKGKAPSRHQAEKVLLKHLDTVHDIR